MASLEMKIKAERRMRELLEEEGIPLPDRWEYGYGCIRLFWRHSKVMVVVDIDDEGEIGESWASPRDMPFDQAEDMPFDQTEDEDDPDLFEENEIRADKRAN